MSIINLADYAKEVAKKGEPMCITFFSATFRDADSTDAAANVTVTVENGDVLTVLEVVKEKGGILRENGERHVYIPWPCACVVIHRPDQTPIDNAWRRER